MNDSTRRRQAGRWAASQAAKEAVRTIAVAFERARLPMAPLKGVLLIHAYGRDPFDRSLSDVDVLVPPDRFEEASQLVSQLGWRFAKEERGGRQRLFLPGDGGLSLDLHAQLFPQGVFRLSTEDALDRARVEPAVFCAPVLVLHPLDVWAHLIGHAALTFLFEHRTHHLQDLAFLAKRESLSAEALAHHLKRAGMDAAARYVLALSADEGDVFAPTVLKALGHDRARDALAWGVRKGVPLLPERRGVGLIPPAVLHRSVSGGARNLAEALARRLKR